MEGVLCFRSRDAIATTSRKVGSDQSAEFPAPLSLLPLSLNTSTSSGMSTSTPEYPLEEASSYGKSLSGCIVTHSTS